MRRILLLDTNRAFCDDVESRLILDDLEDVHIIIGNNFDNISAEVEQENPSEILISARIIPIRPDWNLSVPVKCYARSSEDIALANTRNIPCYGVVNTAKELLRVIETDRPVVVAKAPPVQESQKVPEPVPQSERKDMFSGKDTTKVPVPNQNEQSTPVAPNTFGSQPAQTPSPVSEALNSEPKAVQDNYQPQSNLYGNTGYPPYQVSHQNTGYPPQQNPQIIPCSGQAPNQGYENYPQAPYSQNPYQRPAEMPAPDYSKKRDIRSRLAESKAREEEAERARTAAMRKQQEHDMEYAVEKDMGNIQQLAKVITVYSAKGGVGKTTIACELATYLALTHHGKGNFRVCIVDLNVDFGDVLNTLSFDADRACMTYWVADIKAKLDAGYPPESIRYTEAQISAYLQKNEKDGLYALLAPVTHEDSMQLTDEQIGIMLDNLIRYGGFDFVICDTGNNTRDSSIIALERADEALLVMTQDVNTANCNNSILSTMHKISFDMNKFRLVINKARPAKEVGISTDELEEIFQNPLTGKSYPCIVKIKDDNRIKQANNVGEPLVYNSSHEFTKNIGIIAKEVIGEDFVLGKPEKKGLFRKLFGKKKDKQKKDF